jgi:hypothetical protein
MMVTVRVAVMMVTVRVMVTKMRSLSVWELIANTAQSCDEVVGNGGDHDC